MIQLKIIEKILKDRDKYWVVFTGDSITSCEWVHPNWRDIVIYVLHNELTELLGGDWKTPEWGIRGFNFAYDGATTKDILEKIDDILLVKPQLVIGLMGGNDPFLGVSVGESMENIKRISELVIGSGARLVWCSSTPARKKSKKNSEYEPYARAFLETPEKENFLKIDMFNLYQAYPTERFFTFKKAGKLDLDHPNQLGNAYIAKIILEKTFGVDFDPEKYISDTVNGEKYPGY